MRFAGFELRLDDRTLWANGQRVALGARPIGVLEMLVQNRHRAVSKDELLEQVWDRIVEENNLQVQIAALRRILGAQAIVTVPGRGYRFAEDVEELDAPRNAAAAPAREGNVGPIVAPILGRERDKRALIDLIETHALVTLSGSSGIGKTRLAEAIAQDVQDRFVDGVWMIELAALTDPKLVATTIAQTMKIGVLPTGQTIDSAQLGAALRMRRSLVVLDNAEHVVDAVGALVASALRGSPEVRLLVTSQEPLRLPAEHVYRLAPLDVPEQGASGAHAADFGAVQLFVERARSADAAFRLHAGNVDAIVEICRRLDGLPLAIELAAARVPALGVEGVRTKLNERFRLLTAGHRMVPPRHKTLRAAMDWSYGLLGEDEAAVYRRLGVFVGSFSLAAAQEVASDERIDEWAVIEHLASLVDKSLILPDGEDEPRYRMLESTREHAIDLMDQHRETDLGLARHAQATRWALERAIKSRREDLVLAELGNVRSAFAWAVAAPGQREAAIALATLPCMVMAVDGAVTEAADRMQAVEPLVDDTTPPRLRAMYWQWLGRIGVGGRSPTAKNVECLHRAEAIFDELDDERHVHACRRHLAEAMLDGGDVEGAAQAVERARAGEHAKTPVADRMRRLRLEGLLMGRRGNLEQSLLRLTQAHAMAQAANIDRYELVVLDDLARIHLEAGRPEDAAVEYRALADRARHSPNAGLVLANSLSGLVAALTMHGDLEGAEKVALDALGIVSRSGLFLARADIYAYLMAMRGHSRLAARLIGASERFRAHSGVPPDGLEKLCRARARERLDGNGDRIAIESAIAIGMDATQDELVADLEKLAAAA